MLRSACQACCSRPSLLHNVSFQQKAMRWWTMSFDALVVGAGGAGLRAAVGLAEHGFNAACASINHPYQLPCADMEWIDHHASRACAHLPETCSLLAIVANSAACGAGASQSCSQPDRTRSQLKEGSMQHWETWQRMIGGGMPMTPSKGSDWLGDQDAIQYMCREAPASSHRA